MNARRPHPQTRTQAPAPTTQQRPRPPRCVDAAPATRPRTRPAATQVQAPKAAPVHCPWPKRLADEPPKPTGPNHNCPRNTRPDRPGRHPDSTTTVRHTPAPAKAPSAEHLPKPWHPPLDRLDAPHVHGKAMTSAQRGSPRPSHTAANRSPHTKCRPTKPPSPTDAAPAQHGPAPAPSQAGLTGWCAQSRAAPIR